MDINMKPLWDLDGHYYKTIWDNSDTILPCGQYMAILIIIIKIVYNQEVKVEKVEEFEPGQDSYLEVSESFS